MAAQGEDVYVTLLLSDNYLPGALVLAHSLRDGATKKKLAVMVTEDTVSAEVISLLQNVYDYILPVPRIRNESPENLHLMNRADLHSAFTKINLWKQTQFRRIVYIDADVVAYRAPDELFDIDHPFSASPDIGWPDLFNTGVMALTPNLGDYHTLQAMAEKGISFDGADQGLLNQHFKDSYNRLPFTYNVTPSAHYQYVPAYRHFQSSINMVHFIGPNKPWTQDRPTVGAGGSPFDEISNKWWVVYDQHYGPKAKSVPELLQYFVKGEYQPRSTYPSPPRDVQYQLPAKPAEPQEDKPAPIFPWEAHQPKASRVFHQEPFLPQPPFPATQPSDATGSGPSFSGSNAWDDVPQIERYVGSMQTHKHGKSRDSVHDFRLEHLDPGSGEPSSSGVGAPQGRSSRVTDFPTEEERPSLPVTPAPIRRPNFWGGGGEESVAGGEAGTEDRLPNQPLPAAEGVPAQSDWV